MIALGIVLITVAFGGVLIFVREEIRHHNELRERNRADREAIRAALDNAKQHPTISRP